jgi:hypothetical protein
MTRYARPLIAVVGRCQKRISDILTAIRHRFQGEQDLAISVMFVSISLLPAIHLRPRGSRQETTQQGIGLALKRAYIGRDLRNRAGLARP